MKSVLPLSIARRIHPTASMCITVPIEVIRVDVSNMQIRKDNPLGIIHLAFLRALYIQDAGTVRDFHRLFGIGISLSRVVVRDLLRDGLAQDSEGNQSWRDSVPAGEIPMVQFHEEEEFRSEPNELDERTFGLTEEGERVVETGRYTPTVYVPKWYCYFTLVPMRFLHRNMLENIILKYRGRELDDSHWEPCTLIDEGTVQYMFSEKGSEARELRSKLGIPYEMKGPLLEDVINQETGVVTKPSEISLYTHSNSITLPLTLVVDTAISESMHILDGVLPPQLNQSDPTKLPGSIDGQTDLIDEAVQTTLNTISQNIAFWSMNVSGSKNTIKYGGHVIEDGRIQHLLLVKKETENLDASLKTLDTSIIRSFHVPEPELFIELEARLIPGTKRMAEDWLLTIIDTMGVTAEQSLEKEDLTRMIEERTQRMKKFWVSSLISHVREITAPSVDTFIDRRWEAGDWKLIYQLSFKEDFPNA